MKQCLVLRHVAFEDLGVFAGPLAERGFSFDVRQAGVDAVSDAEWRDADLAVVLGGPIGAYEHDRYPWLDRYTAQLGGRVAAGRPTVGVCLGAQLIAAALGQRVYPGTAKEIGWAPVELSEAGRAGPLAALEGKPVLHWHGDTFDLPEGATRLASTKVTPNQAFAIGDAVLGLQFHPEVDPRWIEAWLIGHTAELAGAGMDLATLRADTLRHGEAAAAAGRALITAWLDRAFPNRT
jgi:GMP synthase (glutamine-hydrolysing)